MAEILSKQGALARRFLVTVGVILLVRLIYCIPVPGVQLRPIIELYHEHIQTYGGSWFDFMSLFHVGRLRNISLFSLGIMPFINACIIIQIIGYLVPEVKKIIFQNKDGRRNMMLAALAVTLLLSAMHAYSISLKIELLDDFPDIQLLYCSGLSFQVLAVISLCAAVMILVLLSEVVNRFGVGNGVGVIFVSEVLVRLILAFDQVMQFYAREVIQRHQVILFFVVVAVFLYFARKITRFRKKIELSTHEGGEKFFISVRPFWSGVWPLIIAEAVFSMFEFYLKGSSLFAVAATIVFFSLLYVKAVYNPRRFYEQVLSHNCRSCEQQGKRIEDFLNHAVLQCVLLSALLFGVIFSLPLLLPFILNVSFLSAGIFGSFGLVMLVGMHYDIARQVKFYQRIKRLPIQEWWRLDVARDEAEAEVKKACLRSHGVMTEIRPSHFAWGMPVMTIASGYSLFVPTENVDMARQLLEKMQAAWKEKEI
ncbi:MAG: hypothetical protein KJ893_02190 [Candidatus Omnitrophica bacterium]|nr:hypothetical protein [Candidatus Omnitrophota bacterium]MBU4478432.1 hypothetical protein [Candidatus Omnitrophota bacterium]